MTYFFSALSLLAAVVSIFTGVLVLYRAPRQRLNILFMLYCLTTSYWAYAEHEYRHAESYELARAWFLFGSFWPLLLAFILHFMLVFTGRQRLLSHRLTYVVIYGLPLAFSLLELRSFGITGGPASEEFWGWAYGGPQTALNFITSGILIFMGFIAWYLALSYYRKAVDAIARRQALFITLGLGIPQVAAFLAVILPLAGIRAPEMVPTTLGIGTGGFIGYAIWKYQLFGITPAVAAGRIISSMSEGLLLASAEGKVVNANPAVQRLLGWDEEELVGRDVDKVLGEGWRALVCNDISCPTNDSAYPDDFVFGIESELQVKSGLTVPVLLSYAALRDSLDRQEGAVITLRDISRRKDDEEKILGQSRELKERNIGLLTLSSISAMISQTIDLDRLLDTVLKEITGMPFFDLEPRGGIFLMEEGFLRMAAELGHDEKFFRIHQQIAVGECLCGRAAASGELLTSANSLADARHTIRYAGIKAHGHVIVPLKSRGEVNGILCLYTVPGAEVSESRLSLFRTIGNQLGVAIENARRYEEVKELSLHDPLTGLANRNLMKMELDRGVAQAHRGGQPFSLLMLDLDHFKRYNDTYGHVAGDRLLADIGRIIMDEVREVDLAVRYGGEEFLAILVDAGEPQAAEVAGRIRRRVEETPYFPVEGGPPATMTISIGVATWQQGMESWEKLLTIADDALYRAKEKGRDRVEVWGEGF